MSPTCSKPKPTDETDFPDGTALAALQQELQDSLRQEERGRKVILEKPGNRFLVCEGKY